MSSGMPSAQPPAPARRARSGVWTGLLWAVIALLVLGGGVLAWLHGERLPTGPLEPVWDRQACAYCRMHLGERAFAAQLQTTGGEVRFYDDPGCLVRDLEETRPSVHAIWFHHLREQRWVRREQAGFVAVSPTPMGFGLGVVDAGEPGAFGWEQARRRVLGPAADSAPAGAERGGR
ncbi:MAG: hypothetical protein KatS3mg102_2637 [Planctomycetota bacterium]|nr:MAG: hypothetical protein KatS3mg102_2637 [Planctomycetota bacterium]